MNMKRTCGHKNHKMERFLEVCLLLLLHDEAGYGYGLIEELEQFGFSKEEHNVGSLYRVLRKMEEQGLVVSSWGEGGPGPKRRMYEISEDGKKELHQWIEIMKMRRRRIDTLINAYEEKVGEEK